MFTHFYTLPLCYGYVTHMPCYMGLHTLTTYFTLTVPVITACTLIIICSALHVYALCSSCITRLLWHMALCYSALAHTVAYVFNSATHITHFAMTLCWTSLFIVSTYFHMACSVSHILQIMHWGVTCFRNAIMCA